MHQQMACTEIPDFIPYSPGQRPKIENAKLNKNNLKCVLSIFGANEGRAWQCKKQADAVAIFAFKQVDIVQAENL